MIVIISENSINNLLSLKYKIQSLDWVDSVVTILDIPLLNSTDKTLTERLQNFSTLKSDGIDKNRGFNEILNSPVFRNFVISEDGKTSGIIVNIKKNQVPEEYKSEKDNLKRLPLQIQYYNKVFDYVTIVVGRNHLEEVKEMVPEFWGIMEAKNQKGNSLSIKSVRHCKLNPKIEAISLAQLLWKNETLEILERLGKDRGYKSKPRRALWQRLTEVLSLEELNSEVRSYLKNRKGWRTTDQQLVLSGG